MPKKRDPKKKTKPPDPDNENMDQYTQAELENLGIQIEEHDTILEEDVDNGVGSSQDPGPVKKVDRRTIHPISMSSVKMPLIGIIANIIILAHIERLVKALQLVTCRAYELLRLFIISEFKLYEEAIESGADTSEFFVKIPNDRICQYALTIVANAETTRETKVTQDTADKNRLKQFFIEQYLPLIYGKDHGCDLSGEPAICRVFEKTAIQMETAYKNNLKMHFIKYFKRYLKLRVCGPPQPPVVYPIGSPESTPEAVEARKTHKKELAKRAHELFTHIVNLKDDDYYMNDEEGFTVFSEDYFIFHECLGKYVKDGPYRKDENGLYNLVYDFTANPDVYFIYMLRITKEFEKAGVYLNQTCPLRTSEVPCHITIQRTYCAEAFGINTYGVNKNYVKGVNKRVTKEDLRKDEYTEIVWSVIIKTRHRIFNHMRAEGYEFYNSFQTDGVSCTLTFAKFRYENGNRVNKLYVKPLNKKEKRAVADGKLVTNLTPDCKADMLNFKLVGVDPGKGNMVFMIDEEGNILRYTSKQRNQESRSSLNRKIRDRLRRLNPNADTDPSEHNQKADGKSAIEVERALNEHNSMTMDPDKFKEYIKAKVDVSSKVRWLYHKLAFRRMNLRHYIYARRSLDKFVNRIKKTYGETAVLGYGNWSRTTQMSGLCPTMGKGLRTRIEKAFTAVTINEAYTSQRCNRCAKVQKLGHKKNERGYNIHRVLVCKECCNRDGECRVLNRQLNRDINGAKNILEIFRSELEERGRPNHLKAETSEEVSNTDAVQAVTQYIN